MILKEIERGLMYTTSKCHFLHFQDLYTVAACWGIWELHLVEYWNKPDMKKTWYAAGAAGVGRQRPPEPVEYQGGILHLGF